MNPLFIRPDIAVNDFLPIFVESALVLVVGAAYAAVMTLVKMQYFTKPWAVVAYLLWGAQTYLLYDVAILIQSNHFTVKVLMVAMVAYLFVPHLYYYLITSADRRYERVSNNSLD